MEGGGFPNGDDSWLLEPYISFEPQLRSSMKTLEVSACLSNAKMNSRSAML